MNRCPSGGYCGSGVAAITTCGAGSFSGEFSIEASGDCTTCPAGHYCPDGAFFPTVCPMGTYNSNTGQDELTDCTNCPDNKPCPYTGLTTYEVGLWCLPGHYCPAGTKYPGENPCPAGTYSDDISITADSGCTQCPEKFACYEGSNSMTMPMVRCTAGYYCPAGTEYPT